MGFDALNAQPGFGGAVTPQLPGQRSPPDYIFVRLVLQLHGNAVMDLRQNIKKNVIWRSIDLVHRTALPFE
jgi:hypothetical protein